MVFKVFAIYDSKALAYANPWFAENAGVALRAFADGSNDPKAYYYKHPGDYQLYEIGQFDANTGMLTSLVPMKLLGCALDFVESKPSAAARVMEEVSNGKKE